MSERDTERIEGVEGIERTERRQDRGQLRLLTSPIRRPDWELDERTRQIGRAGIAAVRETLRRAQPPEPFPKAS